MNVSEQYEWCLCICECENTPTVLMDDLPFCGWCVAVPSAWDH